MDIRRRDTELISEHGGTIKSLFFYKMEELRTETMGGYLEFIDEFTLAAGGALEPHSHDSDEFYYLLEGSGTMTVADESEVLRAGELVRIRPNLIHSIRADQGSDIRAVAFAVSYMPEDKVGYTAHPTDGREPHFVSTHYWDEGRSK